jgi:hypothetical protein
MLALGPIAFTTPWLLLGLFALPVLWWLLRAMPPAPARRRFAAVSLLLGLKDAEAEPHHTPWWLLLLRAAALALLIAGLAGPILNPREATGGRGPLLILADASWASAQDWPARLDAIEAELAAAGRAGRPVTVVTLADPPAGPPLFQPAEAWEDRTRALTPSAWEPGADRTRAWRDGLGAARFDTVWLSDGLARPDRAQLRADLAERGALRVIEGAAPRLALARPALEDGALTLSLRRSAPGPAADLRLIARGTDPTGAEAALGAATIGFAIDATAAEARFDMPLELANRVERIQVEGVRSAGAVALSDDSVRRRKVALYEARTGQERADLLSPAFYLRRALAPVADVVTGDLDALLLSAPDVLILPDAGSLGPAGTTALRGWVEDGGTLIRFAGPRLAAAAGQLGATDPLLPVALRAGGRSVGGAMSWGEPRRLRPFPAETPFAGLDVPEDVTVTAQVLAQPGPELAERTWAALGRRHAPGDGQADGQWPCRAVPCHGECRMVVAAAFGPVCPDARPAGPGRRRRVHRGGRSGRAGLVARGGDGRLRGASPGRHPARRRRRGAGGWPAGPGHAARALFRRHRDARLADRAGRPRSGARRMARRAGDCRPDRRA